MAGHAAVARGPAGERAQVFAFDLDRTGEQRAHGALGQAARHGDAITARKYRLQPLKRDAAVAQGERHVEIADEIAAEARLFDAEDERAFANRLGLVEHP